MSPLLKQKNRNLNDKQRLMLYCGISGLLSFLIMFFVLAIHENTLAGGEQTVLRMDLYHQYGPLYAELYDRVTGGGSLVYSWTSGLGGSFLGNLFNYCCSPFALLMLLLGHKNMPEAIALMMVFKAMMSSMTFTYYINKSSGKVRSSSIAFGLLYAFSGYFVAYSWNIMWIDAMAVFPLVILGIERIIREKKFSLYVFGLTYTMITNYYMAYMVCILSVLYFLYYYFSNYELLEAYEKKLPAESAVKAQISEEENEGFEPLEALADTAAQSEEAPELIAAPAEAPADMTAEETVAVVEDTAPAAEAAAVEEAAPAAETAAAENIVPAEQTVARKEDKKPGFFAVLRASRFWKTGWVFALSSVLCFLLAAFALLPVAYCLGSSSATGGSFPGESKIYFNIFDFLANHLPGLETTIRSSGDIVLPNVYCGLLSVLLLPLFYFSKRVSMRKKIVLTVLLGVFYLSFSVNYLNFIWHGFHMPNDLPYRYSFAYSFLLLIIAYQVFCNIDEFSPRAYVGLGFAVIGFVILVQKIGSLNVDTEVIVLSVLFTIFYVVLFAMIRSNNYYEKNLSMLLVVIVCIELAFADTPNYNMAQPKDAYVNDYAAYQTIVDATETEDDTPFYRTELSKLRARMDPCWYGYNGVSTFSSMAYEPVAKFMNKLGMFSNDINSYTYYPQTPVFNSLFDLKYIYDKDNLVKEGDFYDKAAANETFKAYEYKYWLPLAFAATDAVASIDTSSDEPFVVQNNLMEAVSGVSGVLIPVNATSVAVTNAQDITPEQVNAGRHFAITKQNTGSDATAVVTVKVTEPGHYYTYAGGTRVGTMSVSAEGYSYTYASSAIQPFTLDLGYQPEGAEINISYTLSDNDTATVALCIARLDKEKFDRAYTAIKAGGTLQMTEFNETSFTGDIYVAGDNKTLFTSIPYDESWNVYVDGNLCSYRNGDIVKIGDAFIGVKLSAGDHTITFKYAARGLGTGIKLTAFGIACVAFILLYKFYGAEWLENKKKEKESKKAVQ